MSHSIHRLVVFLLLLLLLQLYNVYISPLGLWESGLYAFKVSSHVDEALTKRFWRSIVNEGTPPRRTIFVIFIFIICISGELTIDACGAELHKMQATGLNLESLRGKIVSLGQALERDENVFPVGTHIPSPPQSTQQNSLVRLRAWYKRVN